MPLGKPARPMPVAESVAQFLSGLIGKSVQVDKARAPMVIDGDDQPPVVTVTYLDDEGEIGGVCAAQLPIAAACGAALALMPAAVAEEAVQAGQLQDNLAENWREVANVLVQLLNGPVVAHLRTGEMQLGTPEHVGAFIGSAPGTRHFMATILGYPTGALSFYAR